MQASSRFEGLRLGFARNRTALLAVLVITLGLLVFSFIIAGGNRGSFSSTILSGLFQGMLLFLVASGLSIIFGLMDVLNFAQGHFFMVGAYVAYAVFHASGLVGIDPNLRFPIAIVAATIVGAILGWLLERGLIRPLYVRPFFMLVLTFGVAIVMGEGVKSIFGTVSYNWSRVDSFYYHQITFDLFGQQFGLYRVVVIAVGFALMVFIALLLRRTRIGIIIRAGVEDSEMVEALGINVRSVFTLVFAFGCAVASFGGAVAAPFLGASLGLANAFLLGAVAVVVLGGLGSYEGTAVGSLLVGLSTAVVTQFTSLPEINQTVWQSITPMVLLILVLLIRPSGLFGKE